MAATKILSAEDLNRAFRKGYVKALWEEGKKPSEIAGRVGISVSTVRAWIKKFETIKARASVKTESEF